MHMVPCSFIFTKLKNFAQNKLQIVKLDEIILASRDTNLVYLHVSNSQTSALILSN